MRQLWVRAILCYRSLLLLKFFKPFVCTLMLPATVIIISKPLTKPSLQKFFTVVIDFYQAASKINQSLIAIISIEVLQVSSRNISDFESKQAAIRSTTNLLQNNASRVINCQLPQCLAFYLRSGNHLRRVVEIT